MSQKQPNPLPPVDWQRPTPPPAPDTRKAMMISMQIIARIDFETLLKVANTYPKLLDNKPSFRIDCGAFTCDTVDEVYEMLKQYSKPTPTTLTANELSRDG